MMNLLRAVTGFNNRTGIGCFERKDTDPLRWIPEGEGIKTERGAICLHE